MGARRATALLAGVLLAGCGPSGCDDYAGWDGYEDPGGLFSLRYLAPPWTVCTGTEFERDCRECPAHILGAEVCGGADRSFILWIEPALLDPDFLLIPSYKLEISWFSGTADALEAAALEGAAMAAAGMELAAPARGFELHDGTHGGEVRYRGPVHLVVDESPVARPDEREYRVVYAVGGGLVFRVALDTAIDADLAEVDALLASFSLGAERAAP